MLSTALLKSPVLFTSSLIILSIFAIIVIPVGLSSPELREDKNFARKVWGTVILWSCGLSLSAVFRKSIILNFGVIGFY